MDLRQQLQQLRRDYSQQTLTEESAPDHPFPLLQQWLQEAMEVGLVEPNAMVLATVGLDGQPTARAVLLRDIDERGLVFFTNYESRKAQEIAQNPQAVALFLWTPLERQVRVEGTVEKVDTAVADAYFRSRPRAYQLAAWTSPQSRPIPNRSFLENRFRLIERLFEGKEVPRPPFWGGYRLVPHAVEFWQGRRNRLHDRLLYLKQPDGSWRRLRLAP